MLGFSVKAWFPNQTHNSDAEYWRFNEVTENCGLRFFPLILDLKVNLYGPRAPGLSQIHWSRLCELFFFVITTAMNREMEPSMKFSCSLQCEARIVRVTLSMTLDQWEVELGDNPTNRERGERTQTDSIHSPQSNCAHQYSSECCSCCCGQSWLKAELT